jgi:hypothetical protein
MESQVFYMEFRLQNKQSWYIYQKDRKKCKCIFLKDLITHSQNLNFERNIDNFKLVMNNI